jgi:hypothetical protein
MNGRIYDPLIGRFLSPDPVIQELFNPQNLNRYSYVLNNPLSYIDPSGFFFVSIFKAIGGLFKKIGEGIGFVAKKVGTWLWENKRLIAALAFTAVANVFAPGVGAPIAAAMYSMAVGATAGLIASGGDLRAAALGAISAGAFNLLGTAFTPIAQTVLGKIGKTVAHGFVGGAISVASGGDFKSGFLAAGVSQAFSALGLYDGLGATENPQGWGGYVYNAAVAGVVGGTTSSLSGGDFGNGAMTAAFGRLFNDVAHNAKRVTNLVDRAELLLYRLSDYVAGFGDTLSYGLTEIVRGWIGCNDVVDVNSNSYNFGELSGYALEVSMGATGTARAYGYSIHFNKYQHGGGGVNLLRSGARKFGADWHSFKLNGRMVKRPHYHRGATKSQMKKHRPYQGGW